MIAKDRAFQGIGPAKATALDKRFGSRLREALETCDPAVAGIVGDEPAMAAFAIIREKAAEADLLEWLDRHGGLHEMGVPTALKIARAWGHGGLAAVQSNPYLLTAFLSWSGMERLARALGVPCEDPRRDVAAVEAVLYQRLDANHTATPREVLAQSVRRLLGDSNPNPERAIARAIADGAAIAFDGCIQPAGAAAMEAYLASRLTDLSHASLVTDLLTQPLVGAELVSAISDFAAALTYKATARQRAAIALAFQSRLSVLAGYAGSGKTTSLLGICETAERFGRDPVLIALSGRAAQRMRDATGRPAMTIARFLIDVRSKRRHMTNASMLIIDEASMLDLSTLWRILRVLGDASLVLVGDPAQLPPIGFGLTFHALCAHPGTPITVLDEVMRQSAGSGIPAVAQSIRQGELPALGLFDGRRDGVSFLPCKQEEAFAVLGQVGRRLSRDGVGRDAMQIIAPVKLGLAGVAAINTGFHRMRRSLPGARAIFPGRSGIAVGDPIIWTRNDEGRGLTNGSMGRIDSIQGSTVFATFDGAPMRLSANDGQFLELAYAISVHKAQGSQWPVVIVPIFPSRLMDRTLIYTAITRATHQVVLCGDLDVLHRAIREEAASAGRMTKFAERLASL